MRVDLPIPPHPSGLFFTNLIATLKRIFSRIKPASGWRDIVCSMYAAKIDATAPPTWEAMTDGVYAYNFVDAAAKEAWIAFLIPHDIAYSRIDKTGNAVPALVYPSIHWANKTGSVTGTVRFGIEYTYAKGYGDGAFPASTTIYFEQTVTSAAALTHFIAETPDEGTRDGEFELAGAINDALIETDGVMIMRVFRDGAHARDDIGSDVYITHVNLHYYSDGLHTNERNVSTTGLRWTKQNPL